MESPRNMDRLLCGDVGYGKTEVALRAAFKAVVEGKQVAILAPTTILVQQHYNTIKKRFAGFPVKFDMLSRFRTPKEQREIVRKLREGELDLVVGTHRLLNKDVQFKDLGLLIVDEEHRFGVSHKESIQHNENPRGRADPLGHAHPAYAAYEHGGHPRHEHSGNAAGGTPARQDLRDGIRR